MRRIHLSGFLLLPPRARVLERKPKEHLGKLDLKERDHHHLVARLSLSYFLELILK